MSYHSELERELREENADLRAKLDRYGGEDSADIFEHKGVTYFSLNQVEIPADVVMSVVFGINRSAEHKVVEAVKKALTDDQNILMEKLTTLDPKDQSAVLAETQRVEVPYGAVKLTAIFDAARQEVRCPGAETVASGESGSDASSRTN